MQDEKESRAWRVATLLILLAFAAAITLALHTSKRFMSYHRPQVDVVMQAEPPKVPDRLPDVAIPPLQPSEAASQTVEEVDTPEPAPELRPSVDLPSDSRSASNAEEITPDASDVKGLPDDSAAEQITPSRDPDPVDHAGDDAGRRHGDSASRRHPARRAAWRRYRADERRDCEPVCVFFKGTAWLAGLIK